MEKKMTIIEHLLKNRCRNIHFESFNNQNHRMTINFDITEKEYGELTDNAMNNHDYLFNKYQEKIKLTQDEYIILKNIDKTFKYIARNKDNNLHIYVDEPTKKYHNWSGSWYTYFNIYNNLFQFIKWEDEEPYRIKYLLENCEVIEDE